MDDHTREYLSGKLDHLVGDLAQLLKQMREADPSARVLVLDLHMEAHGDRLPAQIHLYGVRNLPGVNEIELELGLVDEKEVPPGHEKGLLEG